MELEIVLPEDIPVMTLPNVTFFPQALMPLRIFEPRYRQMLKDVLADNRLFAVAGLDAKRITPAGNSEPSYRIGSVGIVRACQEASDGTSNLLLQGLCRVEFLQIITEQPYRRVRIGVLPSVAEDAKAEANQLRLELVRLLGLKQKLGGSMPREITSFLKQIDDPETFVDLAAFSLCECSHVKQKLLETVNLRERLSLFGDQLRIEIESLKLQRKLQGGLPDQRIPEN